VKRKKLFIHQGLMLQAAELFVKIRYFMLVAGYGAGKTSALVDAIEYWIKKLQHKRDAEGRYARLVVGGVTLAHLMKTTIKYLFEDFESAKIKYVFDSKLNTIYVGTVSIILVSLSNPEGIVGFDAFGGFFDEIDDLGSVSNGDEITFQAFRAVNERCRQRIEDMRSPFLIFGSTSQGQKGLYRIYTMFKKNGTGFVLIRGRTQDNTSLDPSYVEELKGTYTKQEQEVFLEGKFLALSSGRVFGSFDWDRHMLLKDLDETIKDGETVYWGQDFNKGYHRGCVFVLRNGILYAVKRYEFPEIESAPSVVRHDFPKAKILWIPDSTSKDSFASYAKELRRYNIRIIYRRKNPLVEDTAFLVNVLLNAGRLFFCPLARETAEAMSRAMRDKHNEIPKGVGKESPIHDCDPVRLVANYLAMNKLEWSTIRKATVGRHEYLQDIDNVIYESDGYVNMDAANL
jgi:hypothetical protein